VQCASLPTAAALWRTPVPAAGIIDALKKQRGAATKEMKEEQDCGDKVSPPLPSTTAAVPLGLSVRLHIVVKPRPAAVLVTASAGLLACLGSCQGQ